MASYPPPPPPPGPPYGNDWRYQRRVVREQARMQREAYRAQRNAYRYQMRSLRRGSIVGPLLLVMIGIVFLLIQTGRISGRAFWDWYGHWWPVLFLAAGVIMLLEWGFDQFFLSDPNQPHYRRRLGGGVLFLLLLLAFVGIAFSGFHGRAFEFLHKDFGISQDNLDQLLGDKHESDQTLAQTFAADSALVVNNPRGDVTVSGTSDDNQIHIAVHKTVYTRTDSDAENNAQQLSPELNTSGNTLTVNVPAVRGGRADLTITVPIAAPTNVTANHGDVTVSSIRGAVNVTANHGDVDLSAITGTVDAHINNSDSSFTAHSITGAVTIAGHGSELTVTDVSGPVSFNGDIFGPVHFERIRDAVRLHTSRTDFQMGRLDGTAELNEDDMSASQVAGPLVLNTRNRNITLDRISGDVSVTNSNGFVDLTSAPPMGNVTIENRSGDVTVTVPEHQPFTIDAQTTNGDLNNDFSLEALSSDTHKNIHGSVGSGGPHLRLITSQGDMEIKKAMVAPLPPLLPPPPPLSIRDAHGNTVIINGHNGSTFAADGSKHIEGKDGVRIDSTADGTTIYNDGKGTTFTATPDGTRVLVARDGTRITLTPDGTEAGIGPGQKPLTREQIEQRIKQVEEQMHQAERRYGSTPLK